MGHPIYVTFSPADEPDAPGTPVIEEVDKNSAKVSWTPPGNDGGSPVTGYNVEVKDPETGKWTKANSYPIKGTSYEVPNLEEGKEYQIRVVAENEAGPGKPSRGSEGFVAKAPIREFSILFKRLLHTIIIINYYILFLIKYLQRGDLQAYTQPRQGRYNLLKVFDPVLGSHVRKVVNPK